MISVIFFFLKVFDELATIKAQLASLPDIPSSHVAKHQVSTEHCLNYKCCSILLPSADLCVAVLK